MLGFRAVFAPETETVHCKFRFLEHDETNIGDESYDHGKIYMPDLYGNHSWLSLHYFPKPSLSSKRSRDTSEIARFGSKVV